MPDIYRELAARHGLDIPEYGRDPATAAIPQAGEDWTRNPIAHLPVEAPTARDDQRADHQLEPAGDVGDWIDPHADDPTAAEVVDRGHPDYVDPWRPA